MTQQHSVTTAMSQSSTDELAVEAKSLLFLCTHFGYTPISVVDDIINAINEIMYRCTEQVEQIFITQRLQERTDADTVDAEVDDIRTGTATLETYLEHHINRAFDRFEVYALRNVFALPPDLVRANAIIPVKMDVDLTPMDNATSVQEADAQISARVHELAECIAHERREHAQLRKAAQELRRSLNTARAVASVNTTSITSIANGDAPLGDRLLFLRAQLDEAAQTLSSTTTPVPTNSAETLLQQRLDQISRIAAPVSDRSTSTEKETTTTTTDSQTQLATFFGAR